MEKKKTGYKTTKKATKTITKKTTKKEAPKSTTNKIKKKKGFTLIELLAVIIILGILMIIDIPSVTKYISDSNLYSIVMNYKSYLETYDVTIKQARLLTYNEAVGLGCVEYETGNNDNCNSAPSWLKNSTFWLGNAQDEGDVWIIDMEGSFYAEWYNVENSAGLRPVIVI